MIFDWYLLILAAFFAGMVDAVVGGGGLIQVPALLSQFPQATLPTLFGTNKIASIVGTSTAFYRYAKSVRIPWSIVLPATVMALIGAWAGASVVAWLPRATMQPLIVVLLIAVSTYTLLKKEFGQSSASSTLPASRWKAAFLGISIGFYDGFFGPGTGSFLVFGFIRCFGMDFVTSSASAKIVNIATNLSAIAFFSGHASLLWKAGAIMALCNLCGAIIGTHLALKHGSRFIRKAFITVMFALISQQLWLIFSTR